MLLDNNMREYRDNKRRNKRLLYGVIILLIAAFLWKSVAMFGIKSFVKLNTTNMEAYISEYIYRIENNGQGFQYQESKWIPYKETGKYGPWEVTCFVDKENRKIIRFSLFGFGIAPSGWWRYMYYSPDNINDFDDPEAKYISSIHNICEKWYWYDVEW